MPPDVDIFLERCDGKSNVVLLHAGDVTAPFQEGHVLLRLNLVGGHLAVPVGSSGDGKRNVLMSGDLLLATFSKENIDHSGGVCETISAMNNMRVRNDDLGTALSLKILR